MAYANKFLIEFTNQQKDLFNVYIAQKDYVGNVFALRGATNQVFTTSQQSGDDSVFNAIRAKECTLKFVAEGGISLINFYSEDDEEYRIDFYYASDYTLYAGASTTIIFESATHRILIQNQSGYNGIKAGMQIVINGITYDITSAFLVFTTLQLTVTQSFPDATITAGFSIISNNLLLSSFFIVQDSCEQDLAAEPFEVTLKGTDNLALLKNIPFTSYGMPYHPTDGSEFIGKISLFDLIKIALLQTGLGDLPLRIYCNLFENTTTDRVTDPTAEAFEQTYIFNAKYLNDDGTWQNLYDILTDILTTFNCQLSQENGAWNIVRLQEAYLFMNNAIPGVEHNLTTGVKTAITLNTNIPIAYGSEVAFDQADAVSRIQRPFKYVKETFNYAQPKQLIRNLDLQTLGALIRTYTVSGTDDKGQPFTNTVNEYQMPYWINNTYVPLDEYFIRVTTNSLGVEVDRIAVLKGGVYGSWIISSSFYIDKNDRVSISFSLRTSDSQTGAANFNFIFQTDTGTQQYKIVYNQSGRIDGTWLTNGGAQFSYSAAQNLDEWTTFSVDSLGCPVEGYFSIFIFQLDANSPINETQYKDFSLTYTPYINDSVKIIGQYHNNIQLIPQGQVIKNDYDEEIQLDDSPKHSIEGALFTNAIVNGDYNTLTSMWHRSNINEERRLGELIVFERMQQAYKARTIIESTIHGLKNTQSDGTINFVSLLCLLSVDFFPTLNFMFGVLEVDWMGGTHKSVLTELYENGSNGEGFEFEYIFNYIFKTS